MKTPEELLREAYTTMQDAWGIEVGDTVRVLRKVVENEMGWPIRNGIDQNTSVGKVGEVTEVSKYGIVVSIESVGIMDYTYPFFVLELVSKKPKSIKVNLNAAYEAEVFKDKVVVGCQTFPLGVVEAILKASKELRT